MFIDRKEINISKGDYRNNTKAGVWFFSVKYILGTKASSSDGLSVLGTASSSMRATRTDKRLCDCLSDVGALSLQVIFAKGEIVPRSKQLVFRNLYSIFVKHERAPLFCLHTSL